MNVVLIGTGNTATILGRLIKQTGHDVLQVYGRSADHASMLASSLGCDYTISLDSLDQRGDLYIIAVTDSAISSIVSGWKFPRKMLVHTAGSVSKDVLQTASKNYGVLYPLQSFRKEVADITSIPFLVDANTGDDLRLLYDFACTLSGNVKKADDKERATYHLAAVVLNNFTNHLITLTNEFCVQTKTDFSLLVPLLKQLPDRLMQYSPRELQTGPAIRNDQSTIVKQLGLLEEFPELKNLYTLFTKSIQAYHYK